VLTGVDITSYRAGPRPAGEADPARRAGAARLRLSSIDSVEADADLLDALGNEPRLMPHLHLSLQAGDDMILKRMKRRHSRADAIAFCDRCGGCGRTWRSAAISSPAFRPRPRRCFAARSIWSTNAG
jgi:threonylcarbamoyladenosine tRNA methylthiotransferase MtaB